MLKVYCDVNDRTQDGWCLILYYGETPLETQAQELGLKRDDKVILYQDPDDFEVVATVDLRYVDVLGREAWVAYPDWSTRSDMSSESRSPD